MNMVWLSEVGDYDNFEEGVKDADSFSVVVPSTNDIQWIEALQTLVVGTAGDEWVIASNKIDTPLTPTNWSVKQQTTYGSNRVQPIKVNDCILFVDFVGRKIRELVYKDYPDAKYVAPDLNELAEHITKSGIIWIAHQKNPDSILWCGLADGSLISMTYDRAQDVVAWAEHPIDGLAQSGCVAPGKNEDEVWISVQRTINDSDVTYIEQVQSRTFDAVEDAFFVDCGIMAENDPTSTTIAGLAHLIGETVTVLGDGVVYTPAAVVDVNGEVTVSTAVSKAQAGLPYTYELMPMRPDISTQGGTSHGSTVHVAEMAISFLDTMNAKYGVSMDSLFDIDWTNVQWTNNSEITGLFTGDVVVAVDGGFTIDNNLIISGSDPLPCTVRALIPRMDKTGR